MEDEDAELYSLVMIISKESRYCSFIPRIPQSLFFWQIFTRQLPKRNHSSDNENSPNAKKKGSDSSIIWEIQDIPDFLFVTRVTCCCCCQMLLLLLWLWYWRYEGQASDVLTFPCYTISLSWHNNISPASDWSLLACTDLWLAGRGQTDIVTDLNMTQASGRHIFCFPDSEAGLGPSPHISRDRDQCLASVGGWHSDIVCVLCWVKF